MAIRSLLAAGLLALPVLALPEPKNCGDTTIYETIYKTVERTALVTTTKTKTKTSTVTVSGSCSMTSMSCPSSSSSSSTSGSSGSSGSMTTSMSSSSATTTNTMPTTTETATHTGTSGMNDYAKATGKVYMGTAADIPGTGEQQDKYYMQELNNTHDFGALTPANVMKWYSLEPEQNVFDYSQADEFVALAKANGQLIRCHNLNWYNQNPDWLTNGNWTNATILDALTNHISNVVAHFGDDCYAWDVVNEAFNDDGTYREDIWYNTTGTSYIFTAFKAAQRAVKQNKLSTKLYYNDYNIEYPGPKSTAAQTLVKQIQARGIKIDGVGLQSHFIVGETPDTASQMANMNAFTSLGVDVAVTELDIRLNLPPTAATESQQVVDYANTVSACRQVERCVGVTLWDFDDTYSWIPGTFPGQGYGDVFFQPAGADTPLVRKAAYDGIIDGWTGVTPTA